MVSLSLLDLEEIRRRAMKMIADWSISPLRTVWRVGVV